MKIAFFFYGIGLTERLFLYHETALMVNERAHVKALCDTSVLYRACASGLRVPGSESLNDELCLCENRACCGMKTGSPAGQRNLDSNPGSRSTTWGHWRK